METNIIEVYNTLGPKTGPNSVILAIYINFWKINPDPKPKHTRVVLSKQKMYQNTKGGPDPKPKPEKNARRTSLKKTTRAHTLRVISHTAFFFFFKLPLQYLSQSYKRTQREGEI